MEIEFLPGESLKEQIRFKWHKINSSTQEVEDDKIALMHWDDPPLECQKLVQFTYFDNLIYGLLQLVKFATTYWLIFDGVEK